MSADFHKEFREGVISIIVPLYNDEKNIERCLNSLVKQSYSKIEIIVVDDGSTDNSMTIVRNIERKDSRIKLISKQNEGVSSARNAGIEKATGEFITFVDSDDYIEQCMYENMIKYSDHDLICCGIIYEDENMIRISTKCNSAKYNISKSQTIQNLFNGQYSSCVWNKLFKHKIIYENNIRFHNEIKYAEDLLFACEYINKIEKSCNIGNLYYHYIQQKGSMMHQSYSPKFETVIDAYRIINEIYLNEVECGPYIDFGEKYMICLILYIIYYSKNMNKKEKHFLMKQYKNYLLNIGSTSMHDLDVSRSAYFIVKLMSYNATISCKIWHFYRHKKQRRESI